MEYVFARRSVEIKRRTQFGLLDAAADLLRPLIVSLTLSLLQSPVNGMEDTPVRVQIDSPPGAMQTARFWWAHGRDEAP